MRYLGETLSGRTRASGNESTGYEPRLGAPTLTVAKASGILLVCDCFDSVQFGRLESFDCSRCSRRSRRTGACCDGNARRFLVRVRCVSDGHTLYISGGRGPLTLSARSSQNTSHGLARSTTGRHRRVGIVTPLPPTDFPTSLHSGKSNGTDDASDMSAAQNQHAQSSAEETKLGCVDFGPKLSPTWSSATLECLARQWLLRTKRSGCERLNDDRLKLLSASPAQPRLLAEEQYAIQSGWLPPLKTESCRMSGTRLAFPL